MLPTTGSTGASTHAGRVGKHRAHAGYQCWRPSSPDARPGCRGPEHEWFGFNPEVSARFIAL